MASTKVLSALLVALLLVAVAAAVRTTTTVVGDDMENTHHQGGSCQEQVSKQDNFNMCQRFLMEHIPRKEFYSDLAMVTVGENPQKGEHLKACCSQMENVSEECRCEGLKMMMGCQQQRQQQMQEMTHMAENLPTMCNIGPKQCQIHTSF